MHAADRTSQHTMRLVGIITHTFVKAMVADPSDQASVLTTASHSGEASLEKRHEQSFIFTQASCS